MNLAKLPATSIAPTTVPAFGRAGFLGQRTRRGEGRGEGEATGGPFYPHPAGPRERATPGSSPGQALSRNAGAGMKVRLAAGR
jgi:hypothetical protein